jgi:hypothetical protein
MKDAMNSLPHGLLSLSDRRLEMVTAAAAHMSRHMRDGFLRALGERLGGRGEIGDGQVNRAVRELQCAYRDQLRL